MSGFDLYNYPRRLEQAIAKLNNDSTVCQDNKEKIQDSRDMLAKLYYEKANTYWEDIVGVAQKLEFTSKKQKAYLISEQNKAIETIKTAIKVCGNCQYKDDLRGGLKEHEKTLRTLKKLDAY